MMEIKNTFIIRLKDGKEWCELLNVLNGYNGFKTEQALSAKAVEGAGIALKCMRSRESFCVEYDEGGKKTIYKDCMFPEIVYNDESYYAKTKIGVYCSEGWKTLELSKITRSAYILDQLLEGNGN